MVPIVVIFAAVFSGIILGVSFLLAAGIHNGLVGLKKQVEKSWNEIEGQLNQCYDLIADLTSIIDKIAGHEKAIIEKTNEARKNYLNAKKLEHKIEAANHLNNLFSSIFSMGEAYPDLKLNKIFANAQNRIYKLDEELAKHRDTFNENVLAYNARTVQFPDMFFAQAMGYGQIEQLKEGRFRLARQSFENKAAA
jgi:LemA protein